MNIKKIIWLILGLGLGALGVVLPVLPTVPFLMLALFSFGKSSERLHTWFIGTKLYKHHLESFANGQGMATGTKCKIMLTVTLLMAVGFAFMLRAKLYVPCGILGVVWLMHIVYFTFFIKKYVPTPDDAPAPPV